MARIGIVGGTYAGQTPNADAERSVNWYPELVESAQGVSPIQMVPSPGLKVFSTPNTGSGITVAQLEVNRKGNTLATVTSVQAGAGSVAGSAGNGADAGGSYPWSNPGNVSSSVNYATNQMAYVGQSDVLRATQFGFNLPSMAVITGIEVTFEGGATYLHGGSLSPFRDYMYMQLVKSGSPLGTAKYVATPSNYSFDVGGSTDLWGATLAPSDVNDTSFGVLFWLWDDGNHPSGSVRKVRITVYYTPLAQITLSGACPFSVGQQVSFSGLTAANFLNNNAYTVAHVSGNDFSVAWTGADYTATVDSGDAFNPVASHLICTLSGSNPFSVGQTVTFVNLLTSLIPPTIVSGIDFNGQSVAITAISGLTFQANTSKADYPATAIVQGSVLSVAATALPIGRGEFAQNDRYFCVVGATLFEVFSDGSFANLGTVANDQKRVSMIASTTELLIASAGKLYLLTLASNSFASVVNYSDGVTPIPNVSKVEYSDGYFVALLDGTQKFILSGLLDGSTWNAADIGQVSVFPENCVSMVVDHREVVIFGSKRTVFYYDSGNVFPFDVVPSGYVDQGCAAVHSPVRLDNSTFWLGQDERGGRMCWRLMGYTPIRISNHAVEYQWSKYTTVSDAVAYGYQLNGHSFYQIYFPTANATWVYDVSTKMWHERQSLTNGTWGAHRSQGHAYCWGKHLVTDWSTSNIYDMSDAYSDDAGDPIRRVRRTTYTGTWNQRSFFSKLELLLEVGLGLADNSREPQVMLRWSDDGCHTWSNEHWTGAGMAGEYRKRVIWRRLGSTLRSRVWEVSVSDALPWRLVDADLV